MPCHRVLLEHQLSILLALATVVNSIAAQPILPGRHESDSFRPSVDSGLVPSVALDGVSRDSIAAISFRRGPAGSLPELLWQRRLSTHLADEYDMAYDAAFDRFGNAYITGAVVGLGTSTDFSTIKVDSSGRLSWRARADGTGHRRDQARAVMPDGLGNCYVSGLQTAYNGLIEFVTIKLDEGGQSIWRRAVIHEGIRYFTTKVTVDRHANPLIVGTRVISNGDIQWSIISYDADGTERWIRDLTKCGHIQKVLRDHNDNIYLVGQGAYDGNLSEIIKLDPVGAVLWRKTVPWYLWDAIIDSTDNNLIVTGGTQANELSFYVLGEMSSDGQIVWAMIDSTLGTGTNGRALALGNKGNIINVSLTSEGIQRKKTAISHDSLGKIEWSYSEASGVEPSSSAFLSVRIDGEVWIGQETPENYFLLRLDEEGNPVGRDTILDVIVLVQGFDRDGNYRVAGIIGGDYAVVRFSPEGQAGSPSRFSDSSNSRDHAIGFALDRSERFLYVFGEVGFRGTHLTVWKYDESGNFIWRSSLDMDTPRSDYGMAMAMDPFDNVVVAAVRYNGNSQERQDLVIKIDSSGKIIWVTDLSEDPDASPAHSISVDSDPHGNLYVLGFGSKPGISNHDFVTNKISRDGDVLWSRRSDGAAQKNDRPSSIRVANDGSIYVLGTQVDVGYREEMTIIKYDSLGSEEWIQRIQDVPGGYTNANAFVVDDNLGIVCAGSVMGKNAPISNPHDFLTVSLDVTGAVKWRSEIDSSVVDQLASVQKDHDGNFVVVGQIWRTATPQDFAVLKYNLLGDVLWLNLHQDFPTDMGDVATGLDFDDRNNPYVLGFTYVNLSVRDLAIVAYNGQTGDALWAATYEGLYYGDDEPRRIIVDKENNLYVLESCRDLSSSTINLLKISAGIPTNVSEIAGRSSMHELHQNFPNPFNPTTTISFSITVRTFVQLAIYDLLGREVVRLVNEERLAGTHFAKWNTTGQSTGIYIARLTTDQGSESRKIMVVK